MHSHSLHEQMADAPAGKSRRRLRRVVRSSLAFLLLLNLTTVPMLTLGDDSARYRDQPKVSRNSNAAGKDAAETAGKDDSATPAPKKKKGFFARFFSGFKNIFTGGKSENKTPAVKLQRTTNKDAAKFESAIITRVEDNTTPSSDDPGPVSAPATPPARAEAPVAPPAPTAGQHLEQGRALLNQGRLNEALKELSQALALNPNLADAHAYMAVAFARKGFATNAQLAYEKSLQLNPNNSQTLNNYGYWLYTEGRYREAIEQLKRAAKLSPEARVLNNLALAQFYKGDRDDAQKNFIRAGGEMYGRLSVAALFEKIGDYDEAIKRYESALKKYPTSAEAMQRLKALYQRTGRSDDLERLRRRLAEQGLQL